MIQLWDVNFTYLHIPRRKEVLSGLTAVFCLIDLDTLGIKLSYVVAVISTPVNLKALTCTFVIRGYPFKHSIKNGYFHSLLSVVTT